MVTVFKRIDELDPTVLPSVDHEFPAMKDGLTVKLTVQQMITLAIAQISDSAPAALDTLNELAAALGDDPNYAATIAASLSAINATLTTLGTNKLDKTLDRGGFKNHLINSNFVMWQRIGGGGGVTGQT